MKWLYKILRIFYCPHKWVVKDEFAAKIYEYDDTEIESYTKYVLQCKRCGDLKTRRSNRE